jgi:DNA-binding GntR family transcriptional regulator
LREALNRLTADGFLTFSSQRGFFRKALSVKAAEDLYEWREQLELAVVRLALERSTEAALDDIEAYLRDAVPTEQTSKALLAFEEEFHQRLAALTGNVELTEALRSLNDRIRFMRWVELERRGGYRFDELHAILNAIRAKDLPRAKRLMSAHALLPHDEIVTTVKDAFARIYMERESNFIPPV